MAKDVVGFGFNPKESEHHFLVIIPRGNDSKIIVYERFSWQYDKETQILDIKRDIPKVELTKHKWKLIEETLKTEFNERLKKIKSLLESGRLGRYQLTGCLERSLYCFAGQ